MYPVVYLTGAPAAGKSSVSHALSGRVRDLKVFEFGARLTEHINAFERAQHSQSDLRTKSGSISTPQHVAAVDQILLDFVANNRRIGPVIIDSHPVTKERFGFRITPYSLQDFSKLRPTHIWMLYTPAEVALERIAANSQGRPSITIEEATMHTQLQASVAATYGMSLGRSVELFNSSIPTAELAEELARRLVAEGCAYSDVADAHGS